MAGLFSSVLSFVFVREESNLRFTLLTDGETKEPEFVFPQQLPNESEHACRTLEEIQAEGFTLAGLKVAQENVTQVHSL